MIYFSILLVPITIWLASSGLYIFIYSIAGKLWESGKHSNPKSQPSWPKTIVMIPAYKEDAVIVNAAEAAIEHRYKGEHHVVVIADQLTNKALTRLKKLPLTLIEVEFDQSTKSKSINEALSKLQDEFEMLVLLDADNMMEKEALNLFAEAFLNEKRAIQGQRTARTTNTHFSFLDGLSEEVNNHIYSKGANALGGSSRLVGSGMAFDYQLFKSSMKEIDAVGGFDKALELALIDQGIFIHYLEEAIIYDEKVGSSNVYSNQRKRWISAQYHYLGLNLKPGILGLFRGKYDFFFKMLQLSLPPRLLFPIILVFLTLCFAITGWFNWVLIYSVLSGLVVFAYAIAIPPQKWKEMNLKTIYALFQAAWVTAVGLLKVRSANQTFIHTPHTGTEFQNQTH